MSYRPDPSSPKRVTSPEIEALYHTITFLNQFAPTHELEQELRRLPDAIAEITTKLGHPNHPMAKEAADELQQLIRDELERRQQRRIQP